MKEKKDSYIEIHSDEYGFVDALKELDKNRKWFVIDPREKIEFEVIDTPLLGYSLAEKFIEGTEMVIDTVNNSGIFLTVNDKENYLLRDTACYDFVTRAGFTCPVQNRLGKERLCELLPEFIKKMNKPININFCYGKITAALSQQYVHVNEQKLVETLRDNLSALGVVKFEEGYLTCSSVSCSYKVENSRILDSYKELLPRHFSIMVGADKIVPEVYLRTGSSGDNAIKLDTYFRYGSRRIKVGSEAFVHKGEPFENFEKECRLLLPRFDKDMNTLSKLLEVSIHNAKECANNLLKEVGLNKKQYSKYFSKTLSFISGLKINNAHDLYWAISNITEEMKKDGVSNREIDETNDLLYKMLRLDFKKFDYKEADAA